MASSGIVLWRRWLSSLVLCGAAGCAATWDDITSRDFKVADLWTHDDPLEVLAKSTNNTKRGWAIANLKEPSANGGKKEDQARYMQILEVAALKDPDPYVRMRALGALGKSKDPRAADLLEVALHDGGRIPGAGPGATFSPEIVLALKQQTLASIDQTGGPKAVRLLIEVAAQPGGASEAPTEAQRVLDERLTAIRLLAKYPQKEAVEAMVSILEKEKDIAMKSRVHQSLVTATGKDLPRDGKVWREYVSSGKTPPQRDGNFLAKLLPKEPAPLPPDGKSPPAEPGFFDRLANRFNRTDEPSIQQTGGVNNPRQGPAPATFPAPRQ